MARVLVVDDSDEICELYQLVLAAEGNEVRTACDGLRGFEAARTWRPDLMVVDVVMPQMDGLELLLKLRSDLVPPVPPVILCSGFDLAEEEALRRGAVRFLRKPIEMPDLLAAVTDAVEGRISAEDTVRRQRDRATVARLRVLIAATELVRRIEAHGVPSLQTLQALGQPKIATVAAYLGIPRAVVALVRNERMTVLAATPQTGLAPGFDLGEVLPQAFEVLQTGSALLLADASEHPFTTVSRALGGVRFFAGVPLVMNGGAPVGVVCLFDPSIRRVDVDELAVLSLMARRGSDVLVRFAELGDATTLVRPGEGVVAPELFEDLLDAEMRILDRKGGSMELAVVDVDDMREVSAAIVRAPQRERLIAGSLGGGRVTLFKRAADSDARSALAAVLDDLRASKTAREVGVVDVVGSGARGLSARDLVHVASVALDRAIERGGDVRRVVIEERP
jgi:CheY-like chemotaxis protein